MMGQDLSGLTFLDAFGGSGVMALEAWSRGARVTVVERNRSALSALRERIRALDAAIEVRAGDVLSLELPSFDLVFADPPYAVEPEPVLRGLAGRVGSRLTLETDRRTSVPGTVAGLRRVRTRDFGGSTLHLFEREP